MRFGRGYIFNTVFAFLVFLTYSALASLGESRFDVYTSLYTLIYISLTAIIRPRRIARDYLAVALIALFIYFVSFRIYEVIA